MGALRHLTLLILPAVVLAQEPIQYRFYYHLRGYDQADITLVQLDGGMLVEGAASPTSALPDLVEAQAWWDGLQSQPAEFANGIAIPATGAENPWLKIEADESGDVFAYVVRESPFEPAKAESNRQAAIQYRDDLRKQARTVRTNVVALVNQSTASITNRVWTNTSASAQSAQIESLMKSKRDLEREVRDLAGIVRRMLADKTGD